VGDELTREIRSQFGRFELAIEERIGCRDLPPYSDLRAIIFWMFAYGFMVARAGALVLY